MPLRFATDTSFVRATFTAKSLDTACAPQAYDFLLFTVLNLIEACQYMTFGPVKVVGRKFESH